MKKLPALLIASILLTGCNPAYKRPASENTAHVRLLALQKKGFFLSNLHMYAHDGDTCMSAEKIVQLGGFMKFGGLDLDQADQGMIKDPRNSYTNGQYFEFPVLPGKRFFFTVAGGEAGATCHISSSFIPQRDGQYEVTYLTDSSKCYIKIDRISSEQGKFTRSTEPSAQKREQSCTFFWN